MFLGIDDRLSARVRTRVAPVIRSGPGRDAWALKMKRGL